MARGVTKAEKALRIRTVRKLILERADHAAIVGAGVREWRVTPRAVQRYVQTAREQLDEEAKRERAAEFAEALACLKDVYSKCYKQKDWRGALAAQRDISNLLRLDAPKQVDVTITDDMLMAEIARLEAEIAKHDADA